GRWPGDDRSVRLTGQPTLGSKPGGDPIAGVAGWRESLAVDDATIRRNAAIRASLETPTLWGSEKQTGDPLRDLIDGLEESELAALVREATQRLEQLRAATAIAKRLGA